MTHSINKLTLRRCDANRSAASASEDRIATRLSRSILTSEFRRASRSRTMFTCSRVPKSADFDLRPLYLMAMRKREIDFLEIMSKAATASEKQWKWLDDINARRKGAAA